MHSWGGLKRLERRVKGGGLKGQWRPTNAHLARTRLTSFLGQESLVALRRDRATLWRAQETAPNNALVVMLFSRFFLLLKGHWGTGRTFLLDVDVP